MFTIDRLTQKDTASSTAAVHRATSSTSQPPVSHVESIMPNFGFLQPSLRSSPPPDEQRKDTSPSSSVSSSPPRTPDSQGIGSPVVDDKHKKPAHSYIALIAMAILDSPHKRLLLCDIYQYIQTNYPFYRNNDRSWRNSIRHNLSLNECFTKCGRSGDGRGNFWGIHPANIEDFARGDYRRRRARRRVRAAHELTQSYLYHPYGSAAAIHAAAGSYTSAPVGFVPMSCTTLPPYSMIPPGPFYPTPVSIPYTIPHIMQQMEKPPSYGSTSAASTVAPVLSTTNSISAPIISSTHELRRSPPRHQQTYPVSVSPVSPPSMNPVSCAFSSSSRELSKTVRSSCDIPSPSTSPPVYSFPFSAMPSTHTFNQQQYKAHWDRATQFHQMYST